MLVALAVLAAYGARPAELHGAGQAALSSRPKPPTTITLYVQAGGHKPRGANLQARPDKRSRVELVIPNGTAVRAAPKAVIGRDRARWYKVTYSGKTGYVRATLLSRQKPLALITLYVQAGGRKPRGANLQARPDRRSRVELVIPNGASVLAVKKPAKGAGGQRWYKVTYRGKTGYVLASLLGSRPSRPRPTAAPTARPTATPASTSTPSPRPTDTAQPTATSTPVPTDTNTPTSTVSPFKRHEPPPTSVPDLFPFTTPATPGCATSTVSMNGPATPAPGTDLGTYSFDDEIVLCFNPFSPPPDFPTPAAIEAPVTRPDGAVTPHTVDPNVNFSLGNGSPGYTWDVLPGDPTGRYTVNATEGEATGTGAFTVTAPSAGAGPKILVVPRVGPPGATIKIGLSGFQPGQTVHLYLYRDTVNGDSTKTWAYVTELAPIQTDAQGPTAGEAIYSLSTQPGDYTTPGPANEAPNNYLILTDPSTLIPHADVGTWQTRFAAFCLSGPDPANSGCDDAGYLLPTPIGS